MASTPTVAEFFAGIGLVRIALEDAGMKVVWANDIEACKFAMYESHFGVQQSAHYNLGDVRLTKGADLPSVDVATASFPCTDLSLAGNRAGLVGTQSGMFWEFARVVEEMGDRKPSVVMLENVTGFATSHGGKDLYEALKRLNGLGYVCDIVTIDARAFVPQSRLRMFIVGTQGRIAEDESINSTPSLRPGWIRAFFDQHPDLDVQQLPLGLPPEKETSLRNAVEVLPARHPLWWTGDRHQNFMDSLSELHHERINLLQAQGRTHWRTAYRRTRHGRCTWEIRPDEIAGCLRTARGGSSKQAVVEIRPRSVRVRWMTPREYAALQGAPDYTLDGTVTDNKALFGFGDAVCVPAVEWLAENYLMKALDLVQGAKVNAA